MTESGSGVATQYIRVVCDTMLVPLTRAEGHLLSKGFVETGRLKTTAAPDGEGKRKKKKLYRGKINILPIKK